MVRKWRVLFAVALAACATLAYADPPARVGRVNHVSGAVSFAPAEAPAQWTQAALNRPLTSGDRLWTDNDSRAELHVGSTALRLASLTNVDVLNLDDQSIQIRLAQGVINMRVRELARDEIVEVATPAGAVLIRQPGSYRISTDSQSDGSHVLVNFGHADVITPTQTATVPSSQAAVFTTRSGITFEVAAYSNGDEFDRWSAQRDRREDQVNATRYVSRDMTGYEDLDDHGSWRTLPEYGAVWVPANVAPGWAPYRHGNWVWMSQWGWTWVDDAPWGFAPFHYGRWVWLDSYWAWAPGPLVRRPVYAPALVAFVGGAGFSGSMESGPTIGWFPLGWREPYIPWYRASHGYVRNMNVPHVRNTTNVHKTTTIQYVNRNRPHAVTVVPQQAFVSARPIAQASIRVAQAQLARAEVIREKSPAEPIRASITTERSGHRPPQAAAQNATTMNAPLNTTAREVSPLSRGPGSPGLGEGERRGRLLRRERPDVSTSGNTAGAAAVPAGPDSPHAAPITPTNRAAPAASQPAADPRPVHEARRDRWNDARPRDTSAFRSPHDRAAAVREAQIPRQAPPAPQPVAPSARPHAAPHPEASRLRQAPPQPQAAAAAHPPSGFAHRQEGAPRATPQPRENHPRGEHRPHRPREAPARTARPS
jgi:hypothetical protein